MDEIGKNFWEIPRESVELITTIAHGTYGPIWRGKAWDVGNRPGAYLVAIKTLEGERIIIICFKWYIGSVISACSPHFVY